jgi:sigma-B regulation protein RsbU (phosphoserine phosphatase)
MLPGLQLEERRVTLAPGDLLVAYSDGVPDAMNPLSQSYGLERLLPLLERHRAQAAERVCTAIFDDVFAFRGDAPAFDDITVLVARCENGRPLAPRVVDA